MFLENIQNKVFVSMDTVEHHEKLIDVHLAEYRCKHKYKNSSIATHK